MAAKRRAKKEEAENDDIKKVSKKSKNIKKSSHGKDGNEAKLANAIAEADPTIARRKQPSLTKQEKKHEKYVEDDDDDSFDGSDSDQSGWEEINVNTTMAALDSIEAEALLDNPNKEPIEIQINLKTGRKTAKKEFDMAAYMLRERNAYEKKLNIEMHKAHLLSWLYHGLYLNQMCTNRLLIALMWSQVPHDPLVMYSDQKTIQQLLTTMKGLLKTDKDPCQTANVNLYTLNQRISSLTYGSHLDYVLLVLLLLRSLGIRSRLCICFDVVAIKNGGTSNKQPTTATTSKTVEDRDDDETDDDDDKQVETKKRKSQSTSVKRGKKIKTDQVDSVEGRPSRQCKTKKPTSVNNEDNNLSEYFVDDEIDTRKKKRTVKSEVQSVGSESDTCDSDNFLESKSTSKSRTRMQTKERNKRRVVSPDDDSDESMPSKVADTKRKTYWIEVYVDDESKWIAIEPVECKVDCADFLEKTVLKCGDNLLYVCGFDDDNKVKDVTVRYATDWNTSVRKMRIENFVTTFWWEKVLAKHKPIDLDRDIMENRMLSDLNYLKPIPMSISELKSHPLYVIKRHLLKFQSIYPPDAKPVNKIRDEEIYSRQNLFTLCSAQTWLKYARTVKAYEKPYKIVKGRVKQSEFKRGIRQRPDLELFGFWQTEPYQAPIAVDGKVPCNEYGNVYLFQKSMLPVGCCHLQNMPNLNKLCKKLKIDCIPAVVGFDAHHGFSHAVFDGWIICNEFKGVVVDAFNEEVRQNAIKQAEEEKEKVLNNWRTIVKSLLIRERLKDKYEKSNNSKAMEFQKKDEKEKPGNSKTEQTQETEAISLTSKREKKIPKKKVVNSIGKKSKPQINNPEAKTYETRSRTKVNYKIDNSDDEEFLAGIIQARAESDKNDSVYEPDADDNVEQNLRSDHVDDEYDFNQNRKVETKQSKRTPLNGKKKPTEASSEYFSQIAAKFSTVREEPTNGLHGFAQQEKTFNLSEDED